MDGINRFAVVTLVERIIQLKLLARPEGTIAKAAAAIGLSLIVYPDPCAALGLMAEHTPCKPLDLAYSAGGLC